MQASNEIAGRSAGSLKGVTQSQGLVVTAVPEVIPTATSSAGILDISLDPQLYPGQEAALGAQISTALSYVSERYFGRQPAGRVSVVLTADPQCALSGVSHVTTPAVQVYTCNSIEPARAVAILAHEFVHRIADDHYPRRAPSGDTILSEGLATWGAGDYWLGDQPCFAQLVRQQRAAGVSYPLAMSASGESAEVMNGLYYQWASFVEFLLDRYGLEAFDRLYVTGDGAVGSADYTGVYQRDLATLEAEWLAWLAQGSCPA